MVRLGLLAAALLVAITWPAFGEGIGSDAAAIEKARRQGQQTEAGQQGTPIVPAQQQEPDAWNHNDPCKNPPTREEADLCQQWRMAEATEELRTTADARYSWTIIQSGLLAVTFVATAVAAWAAVYAARAAQAAVKVSAEMGKRQMRAYVNAYDIRVSNFVPDMIAVFSVTIKNTGATFAIYQELVAGTKVAVLAGYVRYYDFRAYLRPSAIKKGGVGFLSAAERNNYAN